MLTLLYQKVRYAEEPNNPQLIRQYLQLSLQVSADSLANKRCCLIKQFQLLIEIIADDLLPSFWRAQCMDHIYLPLRGLQQIANCRENKIQILQLQHELRVTANYFQAGIRSY